MVLPQILMARRNYWQDLRRFLLRGEWPHRRFHDHRGGFMILMTLIAVAMVGLLMVSASPDVSSFGATMRSRQLDDSLTRVRRVLSQDPLYLSTAGVLDYSAAKLYKYLDDMTIDRQIARNPGGKLGVAATFLTTIPSDPHVPAFNWFRPGSSGQAFWSVGYNLVRNGNFAGGTRLEAYEPGAFSLYCLGTGTSTKPELFRMDRFGRNILSFRVPDVTTFSVSPDGSAVVFLAQVPFEAAGTYELFLSRNDGSIIENLTTSYESTYEVKSRPLWFPLGGRILFRVDGGGSEDDELRTMPSSVREDWKGSTQTPISNGTWAGMDIFDTFAISPDAKLIAYAYKRVTMPLPRLAVYDLITNSHKILPDESGPEVDPDLPMDFSPSSQDLLFGSPNGTAGADKLQVLRDLPSYPLTPGVELIADSGDGPYFRAYWYREDVRAGINVTGRWIVFSNQSNEIRIKRAELDDINSGTAWPSFKIAPPDGAGFTVNPDTLALSRRGTHVAYADNLDALHLASIDGTRHVPLSGDLGVDPNQLEFSPTETFWTFNPMNCRILSSQDKDSFDPLAWSDFLSSHTLYDGDNRFGSSLLKITSSGRQHHFLLDDGVDTYLVEDRYENRGETREHIKVVEGVNMPSWDPRGLTFAGKSSHSEVGLPLDVFKNALDVSATTVLLTTGTEHAISPDALWVATSKHMTEITTYPGPRIKDPIPNMDIWIANAIGAPEPKERNLTPNTPSSQERYPAWSPDGKYIYYQRETQRFTFHHAHSSEIWRMTVEGGAHATVVSSGALTAFWSSPPNVLKMDTKMEAYFPSVSPDGSRLAFVAKERLYSNLNKPASAKIGDIISESIYILNLRNPNAYPVPIIRSGIPDHPASNGPASEEDWGFYSLSWNPNGQEVFAVRIKPIVRRFPGVSHEGARYQPNQPEYAAIEDSQVIRVVPRIPQGTDIGGEIDPFNDNFSLIFRDDQILAFMPTQRILRARYSYGPYAYQYLESGTPLIEKKGIGVNRPVGQPYVLSGYLRTSLSSDHHQQGQIMAILMNDQGLIVSQNAAEEIFESGVADSGGPIWNRYSVGIEFYSPDLDGGGPRRSQNVPILLSLYTLGPPGSWVEFTGLQLEDAYAPELPYPTVFTPTWNVHSPSDGADDTRPGFRLFER